MYKRQVEHGTAGETAFRTTVECVTGPLSRTISHDGIKSVYEGLSGDGKQTFERVYNATYRATLPLIHEIYDEVSTGNEVRSVVVAGARLDRFPMGVIDRSPMWQVGEKVRDERGADVEVDPFTAGVYCATMMAQIDVLLEHGHPHSEIANESVIEAVDSLNPYMHARGVAHMVDNCSTTARLGARKWAPRFDYTLMEEVFPAVDEGDTIDDTPMKSFENHPIHEILARCAELRPSVDIFVE